MNTDHDRREALQVLGQSDAAFARRARGVEMAFTDLVARARKQRDEWLEMVRLRLGRLVSLAGEWSALSPLLDEEQIAKLAHLHTALAPKLRVPIEKTDSRRALRQAILELAESSERFNRRWETYLAGIDTAPINKLRDGYNRYYVFEKECALRNSTLARVGFKPYPLFTIAEVAELLPLLHVPSLRLGT